jgi:hypothetical protein
MLSDYEKPNDYFDAITNKQGESTNGEFAFPCCACKYNDRIAENLPCRICDHNSNSTKPTVEDISAWIGYKRLQG